MNLPWGYVRSHTKFGPDRFSRFDAYWKEKTDKFIYRYSMQHPGVNIYQIINKT